VQKSGDRIRVTVQLVSVQDKAPLWAQTFDEKMADIFTMQDTISEQVARAMQVKLSSDEQRQLVKRGTENVLAYQEYLRGRFFWNKRNEEGLRKCMEHFQQAINLDPNYAQAYVGLADSYAILAYYDGTVSKDDAFPKAKEAVLKALSIDEALSEAHASLALIKTYYDYDSVAAESEYRRAIEINPNYATAHQWYSDFLMSMGRMPESMSEITCAQELDPLSPIINTTLGERLFYMRRYDEAIAQLRYTLDIEPNFAPAHFALGLALEQKGSYVEAVAQMRKANGFAVSPGLQASLAHALAVMGQKSEANKILEELKKPQDCADPYSIAVAYMGLGDRQAAIDWLQKLKNKKGLFEMLLKIDPRLDGIRSDPKFQEIL
jgi:tetratricopeptide (TPR) repeat protein